MPFQPADNVQLVDSGPAFDATGLIHRVRFPADFDAARTYPTLVMSHGFQGNEDVTWIFARQAGPEWLVVAPRAPFPAAAGYGWYQVTADANGSSQIEPGTYETGLSALERFVEALPAVYSVERSLAVLLGFSQGAAISYAFAASHPVAGVAGLGGFLPKPLLAQDGALSGLKGLPILILHGAQDTTIPITRARADRDRLVQAGAVVTYHESEIGHKVSASGMRELARWLAERLSERP